jgi:FKBP12-rapamycin complex-associated protein
VQELTKLAEDIWPKADKSIRQRMAPLAAGAAWNLRLWKNIEDYIGVMPDNTVHWPPPPLINHDTRELTTHTTHTHDTHTTHTHTHTRHTTHTTQPDGTFFKAILNLHKEDYDEAHKFINRTRELLDAELRALVRMRVRWRVCVCGGTCAVVDINIL